DARALFLSGAAAPGPATRRSTPDHARVAGAPTTRSAVLRTPPLPGVARRRWTRLMSFVPTREEPPVCKPSAAFDIMPLHRLPSLVSGIIRLGENVMKTGVTDDTLSSAPNARRTEAVTPPFSITPRRRFFRSEF